ncbi:MAG: LppC family lipoprotein [Gammaproteobacteria bacterium]|nr:MAG: LppC family lipoprotein [Gammaproteobacteria bacterium]RKZ98422.1 MAG: LppC family lipoprotein [Gammaproteobacteria bacterium]
MNPKFYLSLLIIVIFSLTACQPSAPTTATRPDDSAILQAEQAEQSGDYFGAAQQYLELASLSVEQQQAHFYLRAALNYWEIAELEQANDSLRKIDRQQLSSVQQVDAATLEAELHLAQSQAEPALTALTSIELDDVADEQKRNILELKITAYQLTENWLELALTHIQLTPLLSDIEQEQNQQALWQVLMSLTPQALDLFNPGMPPAIDSGWFSLAYSVKAYQSNPDALIVALEDWQRNYPTHPADPALYKQKIKIGTQLPEQLNDVVILLPETGSYASVAKAIKQGILASHYTDGSRTQLHFLDVSTNNDTGVSNVWQRYQQAIELNANLVIGPLDKTSIQILAEAETLPIPVLAFNRLENEVQKENLFQFGLAPEDDAISAADFAINQGYQRTVVLAPSGDWGNRVSSAFNDQWLNNGGILLNQINYNESESDFSSTITPLLGLEDSKQRYRSLKQILATPLEFEPRRRQDIDFVFLVARPLKARQLMPQLKFHRSGNLPVIATSHAYSGHENNQQDIDLNGLIFNDIPWIFSNTASADSAYMALHENQTDNFNSFIRLYALGSDAYRLISELNSLSRSSSVTFQGATGLLSIDEAGYVHRKILWATFNKGKISLLPPVTDDTLH